MIRRALPLLGLFLLAGCGRPPVLEEYSYARGYTGEDRLGAQITYGAGRLHIAPTRSGSLFEMNLRYDPSRYKPIGEFAGGTVRLGTESLRGGGFRLGWRRALPQTAEIGFAPGAALDLQITLGAAEAELDLGGLSLARLALTTGASRSTVRFAEPNPVQCQAVAVTSGAGELRVEQAGNSGCPDWEVKGGVGRITLDLAGAWRADPRLKLKLAVGGVVFQAPRGLGVRVQMDGVVAKFEGADMSQEGKTWTSTGFEQAARKVDIEVRSAVGGVRVEWR